MDNLINEIEALSKIENRERERKAKKILAARSESIVINLFSIFAPIVPLPFIVDFEAPHTVKFLILISFIFAVMATIRLYFVKRRLEAVIELLKLREQDL